MEGSTCFKCTDSEEKFKSFERRLAIVMEEKNLAVEMFQAGAQRIEELEQELNCNDDKKKFELFKRRVKEMHVEMQSDYSDAIEMLQRRLANVSSSLEIETHKVNQKEAEVTELLNMITTLKTERESWRDFENRERKLKERCLELESKCMEYENVMKSVRPLQVLEDEVERLRKQLSSVERQRNEMQAALEETQKSAERLAADELEARHKVCEAISLVETTLLEKQQIENQLMLTENECKRLQKELMELIEEAGKRVKKEVEAVKKTYQEQLNNAQSQMNILETEKIRKNSLMEKQQQEIGRLESELEECKRKSVSQRKLQALSDELAGALAEVERLQTENKSLNEIIMQNQHRFESEVSKCGIERRFLEKQILKLQSNLGDTGHNLERAVEHCHQLSDHLNKLSNELVAERTANENDNSALVKQLQITKIQSNSTIEELKKFVNAHSSISSKWKEECTDITAKFSDRMKELKSENKKEKKRSRKLLKKLTATQALNGIHSVCHGDEVDFIDSDVIIPDRNSYQYCCPHPLNESCEPAQKDQNT